MFLKVIACEIAVRELCCAAARSPNLVDLEFLTQGYHDTPIPGRAEIQKRIATVPPGKYDAITLSYGLCSTILVGLTTPHTPLVIPRAHDCITLFMGSKERYQDCFTQKPGTYYYSSGWLECAGRRRDQGVVWGANSMPTGASVNFKALLEEWAKKYGEDQADYLLNEMNRWSASYARGALITFDFLKHLNLEEKVRKICAEKGWQYAELQGDLSLFQQLVDGEWPESRFLMVKPGQKVVATFDERVIGAENG